MYHRAVKIAIEILSAKTFERRCTIMPKNFDYLYRSNEENHQLTKEAIETALLQLLEKKTLDEINVTELVKRAGVGRNSFYRNYMSKADILKKMHEERFSLLASYNIDRYSADKVAGLLTIFDFIKQNKAFYKVLIKEGLQNFLEEEIYRYQPNSGKETNKMTYYKNCFISAGMAKLLIEWLKNDCSDSPEIFIDVFK